MPKIAATHLQVTLPQFPLNAVPLNTVKDDKNGPLPSPLQVAIQAIWRTPTLKRRHQFQDRRGAGNLGGIYLAYST